MKTIRAVTKTSVFVIVFLCLMILSPVFNANYENADDEFAMWGAITEFPEEDEYIEAPSADDSLMGVNAAVGEGTDADIIYEELPQKTARLAIIIDDLGQARTGIDEIMSIDRPLTLAVMPFMEFTREDADRGFEAGHEIILHMPMEAKAGLGVQKSWLGPNPILASYNDEQICQIYNDALDSVPHISGANIHIGSLVSESEHIMTLIMSETAKRGLYFVDSRTAAKSACRVAASAVGLPFGERDVFLERVGDKSLTYTKSQLERAATIAKETGSAIAIGHVGMEGGTVTAQAIKEMIPVLEAQGIEFVPVSVLMYQ